MNKCHAAVRFTLEGPVFCNQPVVQSAIVREGHEFYTIYVCSEHALEYAPDDQVMSDREWIDGPFIPDLDIDPPF